MNDPKQSGRQRLEMAMELATAPVRRLAYSTPQLVLASPFGMVVDPGQVVRNVTRRLLQTGGGIPG